LMHLPWTAVLFWRFGLDGEGTIVSICTTIYTCPTTYPMMARRVG
jgi:hypothetical protein